MKRILAYLFAMFLVSSFASCGKDGAVGLTGAEGNQGLPGADGQMLRYGEGEPSLDQGNVGDFYIDKLNIKLYGPKTSASWGEGISMKGEDGKDGTVPVDVGDNGESKLYSGTEVAPAAIGKPGDFYFRTTTGMLYGPKDANNTWGAGVSLKGPKGDKGDQGTTNAISSEWIKVNWPIDKSNGFHSFNGYRLDDEASDMLMNGGVFLMYGRSEPSGDIAASAYQYSIPYRLRMSHRSDMNIEVEIFYNGFHTIYYTATLDDRSEEFNEYQKHHFSQFRYVIISAAVPISAAIPNPTAADWKKLSLDQTKKILNLKD